MRGSRRTLTAPTAKRFPGERCGNETSDSARVAPAISKIVLRQARPGLRAKLAIALEECSDPEVIGQVADLLDAAEHTETVAHALFDSTRNDSRRVDWHELSALITQHEAAAGRAKS